MHRNRYRPARTRRMSFHRIKRGLALLLIGSCASAPAIAGYHSATVTVTAYNDSKAQTDDHPHTGAWNNHLAAHSVAVSPDLVARGLDDGTTVAIEGFDHDFVVRDKTADDIHDTIDIYMGDDTDKARAFGKKRLRIWWHTPD